MTDTQTGFSDVETKTQYISVGDARTISYVYDDLGRLVEADYSSGEKFEYAYDAVGNRTTSAALAGAARDTVTLGGGPVATSYQYDAANRLTNAGGVAYDWDERGNLRSDGTYTYTWNAAGRLTATTNGTTTVQFGYDGDGNRLARQVEGGTLITYTLDVSLGLPEAIAERQGTVVTLYLHLPSVIAWDDGTDWHYGLADHLGSLRQVVDDSGIVESASGYRPFGEVLEGDGGSGYGFTGEMAETGLGLVFLRARWYQPRTGRFLSRDAWRGSVSRPGSLNGYAYVLGNPINGTDPSGRICIFGQGNCDDEDDVGKQALVWFFQSAADVTGWATDRSQDIAVLPWRVIPDFCLGDLGCWGGDEYADYLEEYYDDMPEYNSWTLSHPAQAWGLPEDSIKTVLIEDWFLHGGDQVQVFGPDFPATRLLMHHEGVNAARSRFYAAGCPVDSGPYYYSPGESFAEKVRLALTCEASICGEIIFRTPDNMSTLCGALGSYRVTIINNHEGILYFDVYNRSSWKSLLGLGGGLQPVGAPSRSEVPVGGNLHEHFQWIEPISENACATPYPM